MEVANHGDERCSESVLPHARQQAHSEKRESGQVQEEDCLYG